MKFEINGESVEAKKLSVSDLSKNVQNIIKEERMADAYTMSKNIIDKKERILFLSECLKNLPKGEELLQELQNFLESMNGILYVVEQSTGKKYNDFSEDLVPIARFALDIDMNTEEEEETDPNVSKGKAE